MSKIQWKLFETRYTHGKIVNIYIVYEINKKDSTTSSDLTLENCSFGAVTFTKTQILINMGIPVMELDLIQDQAFRFLVVDLAKMY